MAHLAVVNLWTNYHRFIKAKVIKSNQMPTGKKLKVDNQTTTKVEANLHHSLDSQNKQERIVTHHQICRLQSRTSRTQILLVAQWLHHQESKRQKGELDHLPI